MSTVALPPLSPAERADAARLIQLALEEDLGTGGDITSRVLIPAAAHGAVQIVSRRAGVVAGLPIAALVFEQVDPRVAWEVHVEDGTAVQPGEVIADLSGPVRSLLTGERTALNFLTHLSGIASLTRQFVDAVAGTPAIILDTRKTLPGYRRLQKYAVRCGGGHNHRLGLFDAVLIKDNHLAAWSSDPAHTLADAIRVARSRVPSDVTVEIEVDSLAQFREALPAGPDIVLLDNMPPPQMREAVALRNQLAPGVLLEASGGVTLPTVRSIAETGVERISVGTLTHSAPALDLAFDWRR
jgi:nicotinate-nucleotide pyrophosphorylase (carboxylating)